MTNPIQEVQRLGQSIWLDFINRGLISSGRLKQLVDDGLSGMTSNPTIFHKSITTGTDYDAAIRVIVKSAPGIDTKALYDRLIIEDIQMADDSSEIVKEQSESVAATNLKTLGDGPAFYTNGGYAESLANTQAMNRRCPLRMALPSW